MKTFEMLKWLSLLQENKIRPYLLKNALLSFLKIGSIRILMMRPYQRCIINYQLLALQNPCLVCRK